MSMAKANGTGTYNFASYLSSLYIKQGEKCTHTRLKDVELGIKGGAYLIPDSDLEDFYKKYYNHVFVDGKQEYLTEIQYEDAGPLLVDFDFKYDVSVDERKHTKDHVVDMVLLYMNTLKKVLEIGANVELPVFIFEKQTVNCKSEMTKDGIHMIIGIHMERKQQMFLRSKILLELPSIWAELPITNSWDDVVDNSITSGKTGWQLYNSRKPGCKAYLLKYHFLLKLDSSSTEWGFTERKVTDFKFDKDFKLLTARYRGHASFPLIESCKAQIEEMFKTKRGSAAQPNSSNSTNALATRVNIVMVSSSNPMIDYSSILNNEQLEYAVSSLLGSMEPRDYEVVETHKFTMSLSRKHYEPYEKWIQVGWALKNTSEKLFLTWIMFSAQSEKFDYYKIPELLKQWQKFRVGKSELSRRSIMFWSKQDNPVEYKRIREETVDYYIDQTLVTHVGKTKINEASDVDLANVLYHLFKGRFVCVSIKHNAWFEFKDHRWTECDSGTSLRWLISTEMLSIYSERSMKLLDSLNEHDSTSEQFKSIQDRSKRMTEICNQLKTTSVKNNVLREVREMFYDKDFIENLDSKTHLMGFNNGVVDFNEKVFRPGQPFDYISKCTEIDFLESYTTGCSEYAHTEREIISFMSQLFPSQELREYMWEHLASCLIGVNRDQTFNIYNGCGSNGKSKLVELMSHCFGKYKGTVPITLITEKRNKIGGTASEIAQLVGVRYAVMNEPSKGDRINEGPLKELTGGDPVQARALYQEMMTFVPQFKLVVCTNVMFDVKSNDDGTWRRICKVDFESKFCENPKTDDPDMPYQFKIDKHLDKKLEGWAPIFMAMLVQKAFRTEGTVNICEKVRLSSNKYRNSQDYLSEFIRDKIKVLPGINDSTGKAYNVKRDELNLEFKEWYTSNYDKNIPRFQELHEYMDKKFKKVAKGGWSGCKIIYPNDEEDAEFDNLVEE
jgi:P4 family phage/plasmid primase-like protien